MAYGSPNSLDEVGEYLTQIRGGREPTAAEIERLKLRGGSHILLRIICVPRVWISRFTWA